MYTLIEGHLMKVPKQGEIFTHQLDGVFRHFAVCMMREFADRHKSPNLILKDQPIDPKHVAHIKKNMGFEQDRYDRLTEPYASAPGMGVAVFHENRWGVVIIDGNHRIVKRFDAGEKTFPCWIFAPCLWTRFTLNLGRDHERLTRRSGVIEMERGLTNAK